MHQNVKIVWFFLELTTKFAVMKHLLQNFGMHFHAHYLVILISMATLESSSQPLSHGNSLTQVLV